MLDVTLEKNNEKVQLLEDIYPHNHDIASAMASAVDMFLL